MNMQDNTFYHQYIHTNQLQVLSHFINQQNSHIYQISLNGEQLFVQENYFKQNGYFPQLCHFYQKSLGLDLYIQPNYQYSQDQEKQQLRYNYGQLFDSQLLQNNDSDISEQYKIIDQRFSEITFNDLIQHRVLIQGNRRLQDRSYEQIKASYIFYSINKEFGSKKAYKHIAAFIGIQKQTCQKIYKQFQQDFQYEIKLFKYIKRIKKKCKNKWPQIIYKLQQKNQMDLPCQLEIRKIYSDFNFRFGIQEYIEIIRLFQRGYCQKKIQRIMNYKNMVFKNRVANLLKIVQKKRRIKMESN